LILINCVSDCAMMADLFHAAPDWQNAIRLSAFHQANQKQQYDCANRRVQNRSNDAASDRKSKGRKNQARNKRADDPDNYVAQQSKAATFHNFPG
jgi:hypothetical protein